MNAIAKRAMVIGLDGVSPVLLTRLIREGIMPNMVKLIRRGTFAEALAPLPGLTHPNWVSIATGAWPTTHGVTCHTAHHKGEPLDIVHNTFTSNYCKSEFLWNTAERANKRSIILKYLCSWPPTIKKGIQVGGHGYPGAKTTDGTKFVNSDIVSASMSRENDIQIRPAVNWRNLPTYVKEPLESTFKLECKEGSIVKFHLLVFKKEGTNYNRVLLAESKDFSKRLIEIANGEWSKWINLELRFNGEKRRGSMHFKLLELSTRGKSFRLLHTGICPTDRFTYPKSIASELLNKVGPLDESHLCPAGTDAETFYEISEYQANWLVKATAYLMEAYPWDLFFLQWWWPDILGHKYLHFIDPTISSYTRKERELAWNNVRRGFQLTDKMLGGLVKKADKDTVIAVVSDHGMLCGTVVFINNALRQAGLLTIKHNVNGRPIVDWKKTKAFAQRSIYIYVNLKGRDPDGIVNPGRDYEKVKTQVIQTLIALKDSKTGKKPVAVALKKEEAGILGIYDNGENVGDVIYAMAPGYTTMFPFTEDQVYGRSYKGFGSTGDWRLTNNIFTEEVWSYHGASFPGQVYGLSAEKAILLISGPGIKEDYILTRPTWIIDLAPTLAHLLGIPQPRDIDGKVLYQALK